jgi:hypothetical protein
MQKFFFNRFFQLLDFAKSGEFVLKNMLIQFIFSNFSVQYRELATQKSLLGRDIFTKEGIKNGKGFFATFVVRKWPHLGTATMKITLSLGVKV